MSRSGSSNQTAGLVAALLLAAASPFAHAADNVAVIIKLKGSVECLAPASSGWTSATAGQVLPAGTRVKTGSDGLAMVKFLADGSMMRLRPGTDLTIAGEGEEKRGGAKVSVGAVLFDVNKPLRREGFTVKTPTAVATVKGTRFWVRVADDGRTVVVCIEGTVSVRNGATGEEEETAGGRTAVVDGETIEVRETGEEDIPAAAASRRLELELEGRDGTTRMLRIEFGERH